jgi:ABC-type polar amino acid transport system ATPase subunit
MGDHTGLKTTQAVRHSKGYMLSGGERRRMEIARSLVWMAPAKIRKAAEITVCGLHSLPDSMAGAAR